MQIVNIMLIMFAEVYLEPSRTYTMELFAKMTKDIAVNYFCKNTSLEMLHWAVNMQLDMIFS